MTEYTRLSAGAARLHFYRKDFTHEHHDGGPSSVLALAFCKIDSLDETHVIAV
jgi:hypothetical protein